MLNFVKAYKCETQKCYTFVFINANLNYFNGTIQLW